jgi:hypothetical protein
MKKFILCVGSADDEMTDQKINEVFSAQHGEWRIRLVHNLQTHPQLTAFT